MADGTPVAGYASLINNIQTGTTDNWLSKAVRASGMFAYKSDIDFSEINIHDVWCTDKMFYGCSNLTDMTIHGTAISHTTEMFRNCSNLKNVIFDCTVNDNKPSSVSDISQSTDDTFYGASKNNSTLTVLFTKKPHLKGMFSFCNASNIKIKTDYIGEEGCDATKAFRYCQSLSNVDLTGIKVSNATGMFQYCTSLTSTSSIILDTSKITNMDSMFDRCSSLTSIDLDTSSCTKMPHFADNATSLTTVNINTDLCTDAYAIFSACRALKNVTLSSVRSLSGGNNLKSYAFNYCSELENLTINDTETTTVSIDLHYSEKLTVESMLSIFNSLKTREEAPTSSSANEGVVILGDVNLAKLSDEEKAIATNKNWLLI